MGYKPRKISGVTELGDVTPFKPYYELLEKELK